jgi:hypothetical protein
MQLQYQQETSQLMTSQSKRMGFLISIDEEGPQQQRITSFGELQFLEKRSRFGKDRCGLLAG